MNEKCKSCEFVFIAGEERLLGKKNYLCRRNPPTAFLILQQSGQSTTIAQWPPVFEDHWCGEYEPKLSV